MKLLFGICIGICIAWAVWNIEFHYSVKETGIISVLGQSYHVIPWDSKTP